MHLIMPSPLIGAGRIVRVLTDLENQGINLVRESLGILLMVRENDVYRLSCVTVVNVC